MSRPLSILSAGWLFGIIAIWAPSCAGDEAATSADDLPLYRLEVGQEITYEAASEFNYTGGSLITQSKWQIWVVAHNDDDSWRLILHKTDQSLGGRSPRATFAYCDLFPDGRMASNATLGFQFDPAELIVSLPQSEDELRNGWQVVNQTTGITRVHRLLSGLDSGPITIEVERKSPMDEIYESTSRSAVHFDRGRGLVERIETESTQGYGFDGKGTGLTELVSVETKEKEWCETLRRDADHYLEANQQYLALLKQAGREPERTQQLLGEAAAVLRSARGQTSSTIVSKQLDHQIKDHASTAEYTRQRAEIRSQFVGRPSPKWETTDFQGNAHSLEGYRGNVVILDFWYRGCGWCIRAMPQVKQIADSFEGQGVVVCGMNTDRNEEDAQFVIDKMGLNYPNLKATGIPEKYNVQGFPTLIIIDQEGRIHDIHVGYSATLRDDVSESVAQLLSSRP